MCDKPCNKQKCRNAKCGSVPITSGDYSLRARPNLYDLAIMDGILSGGGDTRPVQREAYWSRIPSPEATELQILENPDKWPLNDDLDDI